MWYLYILECKNGALYTGLTNSLDRRFNEHKDGTGGRYTKYNCPKDILYFESFNDKLVAEKRETQIKRWSRAKKLSLIRGDKKELHALSVSRD